MKRNLKVLLIVNLLLALVVGSVNLMAQEKGLDLVKSDTFKLIGAKFGMGKVVKGAPFSATAITESIQTLSDGNQITQKSETKMYRDSEGRTRNEGAIDTIGKWTAANDAQMAFINDPVTGFTYSLDPQARTAYKYTVFGDLKKISSDLVDKKVALEKTKSQNPDMIDARLAKKNGDVPMKVSPDVQKVDALQDVVKIKEGVKLDGRKGEDLGSRMIEGVRAEGKRTTLTIPAGEIGNALPIEVVDETWYSSELQMTILSKHSDPRSGERTYRLTNISRNEPDRVLFEVPSDYTVREESKKKLDKED